MISTNSTTNSNERDAEAANGISNHEQNEAKQRQSQDESDGSKPYVFPTEGDSAVNWGGAENVASFETSTKLQEFAKTSTGVFQSVDSPVSPSEDQSDGTLKDSLHLGIKRRIRRRSTLTPLDGTASNLGGTLNETTNFGDQLTSNHNHPSPLTSTPSAGSPTQNDISLKFVTLASLLHCCISNPSESRSLFSHWQGIEHNADEKSEEVKKRVDESSSENPLEKRASIVESIELPKSHPSNVDSTRCVEERINPLLLECAKDFPKLVQMTIDCSPWSVANDRAKSQVLGRRPTLTFSRDDFRVHSMANQFSLLSDSVSFFLDIFAADVVSVKSPTAEQQVRASMELASITALWRTVKVSLLDETGDIAGGARKKNGTQKTTNELASRTRKWSDALLRSDELGPPQGIPIAEERPSIEVLYAEGLFNEKYEGKVSVLSSLGFETTNTALMGLFLCLLYPVLISIGQSASGTNNSVAGIVSIVPLVVAAVMLFIGWESNAVGRQRKVRRLLAAHQLNMLRSVQTVSFSRSTALTQPSEHPEIVASPMRHASNDIANTIVGQSPPPGISLNKASEADQELARMPSMLGQTTTFLNDTSSQRQQSTTVSHLSHAFVEEKLADGTVRVEVDPTGTFLLPFTGTDPILLDGLHIHNHLAIIGVEFTRPRSETVGSSEILKQQQSTSSGFANTRSELAASYFDHDLEDDDDRYAICLWNQAISTFTGGGFTSDVVMSQTLSQVVADDSSYEALIGVIDEIESEIANPRNGLPNEPIVVKLLHSVNGVCALQVTVSPVMHVESVHAADDGGEITHEVMMGAIIVGVPLDPNSNIQAYEFRSNYLSCVMEECIASATSIQEYTEKQSERSKKTNASHEKDSGTLLQFVSSPMIGIDATFELAKQLNEHSSYLVAQKLGEFDTLDDTMWQPIYSECITTLILRSFSALRVSCIVKEQVPPLVVTHVEGVTELLRYVLMSLPLQERGVMVAIDCPIGDSTMLVCSIVGCDFSKMMANLRHEIETLADDGYENALMSQLFNRIGGHFLFMPTDSATMAELRRGQQTQTDDFQPYDLHMFIPFYAHTGTQAGWERRKNPQAPTGGSNLATSTRKANNVAALSGLGHPLQMGASQNRRESNSCSNHPDDHANMSVMLCEPNMINRHKVSRLLWEEGHAVNAIEVDSTNPTEALDEVEKILKSGIRTFDVVIMASTVCKTTGGSSTPNDPTLLRLCADFKDIVFILRKEKERGQKRQATHENDDDKTAAMKPMGIGIGIAAAKEKEKHENLHIINRSQSHNSLKELVDYAESHVQSMRARVNKQLEIERVLKEHRTSPWTKGKKLGKGTFGDVYEAILTLTGGKAAVKICRMPSSDQERIDIAMNELAILSQIQHPHIVQYFYCTQAEDNANAINIFMELCNGGSLADSIKMEKKFSEDEIATIAQQILSALSYLHDDLKLAHRDIKPANILMNQGKAKLADFGTAKATTNDKGGFKDTAGTFIYMAPEVINGAEYGLPCDLWSVGCVLLELFGSGNPARKVGAGSMCGYFADCKNDGDVIQLLSKLENPVAVGFLGEFFHLRPEDRPTASALLQHSFLFDRRMNMGLAIQSSSMRQSNSLRQNAVQSLAGTLSIDSGEWDVQSRPGFDAVSGVHHAESSVISQSTFAQVPSMAADPRRSSRGSGSRSTSLTKGLPPISIPKDRAEQNVFKAAFSPTPKGIKRSRTKGFPPTGVGTVPSQSDYGRSPPTPKGSSENKSTAAQSASTFRGVPSRLISNNSSSGLLSISSSGFRTSPKVKGTEGDMNSVPQLPSPKGSNVPQ